MYLIIGASGVIGRHLYDYCKKNNIDAVGTYYRNSYCTEWVKFDLCTDDLEVICDKKLSGSIPDAVIMCGANASIDSCKKDENASRMLNVVGTERVLEQANRIGTKIVFLSSEAVFDGKKGRYSEDDIAIPITLYGSQKLEIEQRILEKYDDYLIFRISRAVGSRFGEKDIFDEFYKKISNQDEIICLKNQSFCLTEVNDIAQAIVKALKKDMKGLYHLSSDNYISRYKLANFYADQIFGGYERIVEKEYNELPFIDNRHIYGGLNGKKLANLLGVQFMDIVEIVNKYITTYESK